LDHPVYWLCGFDLQISPFPGSQGPHLTQLVIGAPAIRHLDLSNGLIRAHECDRRQTDRQVKGQRYGEM